MGAYRDGREGEWLDLVADLLARPLTRWPATEVVTALVTTFDAAAGAFMVRSGGGFHDVRWWPPEHFAPNADEILRWSARDAPRKHPILRYYLGSGDLRCTQIADVPDRFVDPVGAAETRERHARWGGVVSQFAVPIAVGPFGFRSIVVGRADTFTADEMALARRVQRLCVGIDRQVNAFASWSARAPGDSHEVVEAIGLTPREITVLDLLSLGLTAAAMGRRLGIAERTVQKHLQRVYAKLGVADRLGAVQRAAAAGLVGGPGPT